MTMLARAQHRTSTVSTVLAVATLALVTASASAQISLTSAADLALRNSRKVKIAEADVDRARAAIAEAHDAYIPTLSGSSSGLGYGYGFPLGTPTIYSIQGGSLVYSSAQRDYIHSAREGLIAANLALSEVRQEVLEDVTLTYLALSRAQREHDAVAQELSYAQHLESIVNDRVMAGIDTRLEFIRVHRAEIQIRLQLLQLEDDILSNQDHLARLTGLSGTKVNTLPNGVPEVSLAAAATAAINNESSYDTPGVLSAMANADSKLDQARGDTRFLYRPVINMGAQYSQFSTYNNAYTAYYPTVQSSYKDGPGGVLTDTGVPLTSKAFGFSLNINIPVLDRSRKARAEIALAEAARARHEADQSRDTELEGRMKLLHTNRELALRAQLANDDREIAQEQLDAVIAETQEAAVGQRSPATPKDTENARISERQRFVDMLDANYLLLNAQVSLLRQTGNLEDWLKSAATKP
jgi:outer membrane protein TolC